MVQTKAKQKPQSNNNNNKKQIKTKKISVKCAVSKTEEVELEQNPAQGKDSWENTVFFS